MNVLLFQNPQDKDTIEWDGIGKDFNKEFIKSEKNYQLAN